MKRLAHYLLLLLFPIAISCSWPKSYPQELVEADTMLIRGQYARADSLLATFDQSTTEHHYSTRMYRRLLGLVRQYTVSQLSAKDFPMADSLVRYYKKEKTRESAMAKLMLADVYRSEEAYPSALNMLLQSEQDLSSVNEPILQIWVNRKIGDVYFVQRMLPECTSYYKKSYKLACTRNDTLRLAIAAFFMARVCMINNKADSAMYYLKKTIEWGEHCPDGESLSDAAKATLADIYIQIEEYDKAVMYMAHDSTNDYNWAYWHLGLHHTDSAYYYFSKLARKNNWRSKVEYLDILAKLEEANGNQKKALEYYKQLSAAKDSLKAHSQAEETRKSKALHEYDVIKQRRDAAAQQNRLLLYAMAGLLAIVAAAAVASVMAWRNYRAKKDRELLQKKLQLKEEERRNRQSTTQLQANERHIALLEKQLHEAKTAGETATAERLHLESALLTAENANIRAKLDRDQLALRQLLQSPLYRRIKEYAGQENFRLTEDEWKMLAQQIDDTFDDFTARLRTLYDGISLYELRICYLLKLGLPSTAIAAMLCRSDAAICMARQRLYYKLTGNKGRARTTTDFIRNF